MLGGPWVTYFGWCWYWASLWRPVVNAAGCARTLGAALVGASDFAQKALRCSQLACDGSLLVMTAFSWQTVGDLDILLATELAADKHCNLNVVRPIGSHCSENKNCEFRDVADHAIVPVK